MLHIKMEKQPDDITCGPTSLQAVYDYFGDQINMKQVIEEVHPVSGGGTLACFLGHHALTRDYEATIYTYNLQMFDPTWFTDKGIDLCAKLVAQSKHKRKEKFLEATEGYLRFLDAGGKILSQNLTANLLRSILARDTPVIAGLSSTYLYQASRTREDDSGNDVYDDVRGYPEGHFVVIAGYDDEGHIMVADPYGHPTTGEIMYSVKVTRLINAILLGIVTYDANLLVIEPKLTNLDGTQRLQPSTLVGVREGLTILE